MKFNLWICVHISGWSSHAERDPATLGLQFCYLGRSQNEYNWRRIQSAQKHLLMEKPRRNHHACDSDTTTLGSPCETRLKIKSRNQYSDTSVYNIGRNVAVSIIMDSQFSLILHSAQQFVYSLQTQNYSPSCLLSLSKLQHTSTSLYTLEIVYLFVNGTLSRPT